jgi:hypothetical protein
MKYLTGQLLEEYQEHVMCGGVILYLTFSFFDIGCFDLCVCVFFFFGFIWGCIFFFIFEGIGWCFCVFAFLYARRIISWRCVYGIILQFSRLVFAIFAAIALKLGLYSSRSSFGVIYFYKEYAP